MNSAMTNYLVPDPTKAILDMDFYIETKFLFRLNRGFKKV
jgi:hypothetical protein